MRMRLGVFSGVAMLLGALVIGTVARMKAQDGTQNRISTLPWDFVVVDAGGRPVGPVIDAGAGISYPYRYPTVAIPFQGKWLLVIVARYELTQETDVYFASSDCTGQPFLNYFELSPFLATSVVGPSKTLYYESGPSQEITVLSSIDVTGSCGLVSTGPYTDNFVPGTRAMDLNVFIPPFRVVRRLKTI